MNELALFAGAGGGILGGHLLGWRTVCAVEIEDYPRRVLLQRQADGILPRFPIWDDVTTFDGKPWRGKVDVISGGFPCQDISVAGLGAGITGSRSGLWKEFARIIGEIRPRYVLVENSPNLKNKGLEVVLEDLWQMGYDARWGVVGAHHVGAPHKRDRIWIVAHTNDIGSREDSGYSQLRTGRAEQPSAHPGISNQRQDTQNTWWEVDPADLPDADSHGGSGLREQMGRPEEAGQGWENPETDGNSPDAGNYSNRARPTQSRVGRVADGVAHRVDRLKAIGNGQVPAVAKLAWEILNERF